MAAVGSTPAVGVRTDAADIDTQPADYFVG